MVVVAGAHECSVCSPGARDCRYRDAVEIASATTGSSSPAHNDANGPVTAVVIPVREAETIVRRRLLRARPGWLPRDRSLAAHITLLAPFLPPDRIDDGVISELERCFAGLTAFGFKLTEVCQFPDGLVYLAPDPATPFSRLTLELHRLFPEVTPAEVTIDEIVPHLTVHLPADETVDDLRDSLRQTLPLTAHAVEAALVHVEEDNTHVIATLPFGTSAA
jgi:hypothetical protein